ncbi:MAG: nucleotidyltransferase domain-containing protein [Nitrococcus sp.]|nr:nucleotidyltransferase domain-containing protein [Nitrococcus sp.]
MNKANALERLQAHKAQLAREFGVLDLAVFGSAARGDAGARSDIDILVRFDGPAASTRSL